MKTRIIVALVCVLVVTQIASGQQHHGTGVRISCPLMGHSQPIKIVRPTYPVLAKQTHVEGRVSLNCLIGPDGLVEKIEVKKGHPLLIQAATDAVSQWKFKPLVLNGKAVALETTVNIDFQLPNEEKKSQRMPAARTKGQTLQPSQSNSTPTFDNCGLTAYPVSSSAQEILAAVPRDGARPPNSMMRAKIAIDTEGRVTHLRVLRLAYPEVPNSAAINEQAVDSIKRWRYAPTRVAGKPVPVCSDVGVTIDLQ